MLGSIADSKLLQITTAGKVATSALTGTLFTLGTTAIAALSTVSTIAGMVSITSTSFVGALTGNASTATALAAGRTILEQVKLRLLQVLLMEQETFQAL
jgi:hypothetical protein